MREETVGKSTVKGQGDLVVQHSQVAFISAKIQGASLLIHIQHVLLLHVRDKAVHASLESKDPLRQQVFVGTVTVPRQV